MSQEKHDLVTRSRGANHLSRNCLERVGEFKPHLLDSGHFKLQIVLLIGEMRKGTSERCLSSLIDREAAHWVAQDTSAGRNNFSNRELLLARIGRAGLRRARPGKSRSVL